MAKIFFSPGIDKTIGAFDGKRHEFITRQKHLHDYDGRVTKECPVEGYLQKNKRDYERNPPKGGELANIRHFGEASKQAKVLNDAFKSQDFASDEQRALVEQYRTRFLAQLKGKADSQAPRDKEGKQRHYYRFDNFIRAMILAELNTNGHFAT